MSEQLDPSESSYNAAALVPPPKIQTASEAREDAIRAAMSVPPPASRLLSLPLEIRREILRIALPHTYRDETGEYIWQLGDTAILRTCHQIHDEGATMMYGFNPFQLKLRRRFHDIFYINYPNRHYRSRIGCMYCGPRRHRRQDPNQDCVHCRPGWRVLQKRVPMANIGATNISFMQHWIIELWGWGEYPTRSTLDLVLGIRDLVIQQINGDWKQLRVMRKVVVKWSKCPGPEGKKRAFQSRILLPFEIKGIAVEEDLSSSYGGW